jgi:hypothetical protein
MTGDLLTQNQGEHWFVPLMVRCSHLSCFRRLFLFAVLITDVLEYFQPSDQDAEKLKKL